MRRYGRHSSRALGLPDRRMLVIAGLGFQWTAHLAGVQHDPVDDGAGHQLEDHRVRLHSALSYKLEFLWAPLIDHQIGALGLRRGWLLLTQLGLIVTIIGIGTSDPGVDLATCLGWAVALGIVSATHDIVVDGYRVEILEPEEQGAGAAVTQFGYRIAMIVAGAGAVYVAHFYDWQMAYFAMAGCVLIGMVATVFAEEPPGSAERVATPWRDTMGFEAQRGGGH